MTTRKAIPSLSYVGEAPMRWLKTASAALDEGFGALCARQWQSTQFARVPVPSVPRARRQRRS
jgi:hypothetical protein